MIRKRFFTIVLLITSLLIGCQRYKNYFTPIEINLNTYSNIHIQWVDFNENDWRVHGYRMIDDWKSDIAYLNRIFQDNLEQYWLAGKEVTLSKNRELMNHPENGLLITFDDVYIDYKNYYLFLSIKFFDLSTNELLFKINREGYFGNSYGFTEYLKCSLDNVSQRIAWVILQNKKNNLFG